MKGIVNIHFLVSKGEVSFPLEFTIVMAYLSYGLGFTSSLALNFDESFSRWFIDFGLNDEVFNSFSSLLNMAISTDFVCFSPNSLCTCSVALLLSVSTFSAKF